jgi:hypothetical protein
MLGFKRLVWVGYDRRLPTEIYSSLVTSLFSDPRTLVVGGLGSVCSALIAAWKTGEPTLIVCALGIIAVTLARASDMRDFARERGKVLSRSAAARWSCVT